TGIWLLPEALCHFLAGFRDSGTGIWDFFGFLCQNPLKWHRNLAFTGIPVPLLGWLPRFWHRDLGFLQFPVPKSAKMAQEFGFYRNPCASAPRPPLRPPQLPPVRRNFRQNHKTQPPAKPGGRPSRPIQPAALHKKGEASVKILHTGFSEYTSIYQYLRNALKLLVSQTRQHLQENQSNFLPQTSLQIILV
ncbi:MAG: hypothetical protein K6E79_09180, partial [Pseudobutyrivibrio sp.]|nr:hypothetical protein [Pseudobutyrivibrio sp.]